jgi:hypothetical protein
MINDALILIPSVMYQFGKVGNTNIDYQNATWILNLRNT